MPLCGRHGMIVGLMILQVAHVCGDGRCDPNSRDKYVHPSPCDYVRRNNQTGIAESFKRCMAGVNSTGCKVRYLPECASDGLVPYTDLHYCMLTSGDFLTQVTSVALLLVLVCIYMMMLSKLADRFFCPVLDQLSDMLGLSADVAGLTLLSFGNGAPDVFAQIAAVAKSRGAPPNWGLAVGAVFGAGMFVTHAVLAGVLLSVRHSYVTVEKGPYLRDVMVYTVVIFAMMMLFVDGHVSFLESCAFSAAYFVYVAGAVMQQRCIGDAERPNTESGVELSGLTNRIHVADAEPEPAPERGPQGHSVTVCCIRVVTSRLDKLLQLGFAFCIPQFPDGEGGDENAAWDVDLVPLSCILLNGMLLELIDTSGQVLLAVLAAAAISLVGRFIWPHAMPTLRRAAPKMLVAVIFTTCIVWMSAVAGELVSVLETLGIICTVPGTVLGVTVLAWGNSLGDMVSNCAVARSGHPTMAIAAIYGGPVFNTLAGMATGLAITTARAGTVAVTWHGHGNEVVLLGLCLLLGQARALIHVPFGGWTLRRGLAWKLIAYYIAFTLAMVLLVMRGGSQACWSSSFCT